MNTQEILLIFVFLAALAYVAKLIYGSFQSRQDCGGGCNKCSADFSKIKIKE